MGAIKGMDIINPMTTLERPEDDQKPIGSLFRLWPEGRLICAEYPDLSMASMMLAMLT